MLFPDTKNTRTTPVVAPQGDTGVEIAVLLLRNVLIFVIKIRWVVVMVVKEGRMEGGLKE